MRRLLVEIDAKGARVSRLLDPIGDNLTPETVDYRVDARTGHFLEVLCEGRSLDEVLRAIAEQAAIATKGEESAQ